MAGTSPRIRSIRGGMDKKQRGVTDLRQEIPRRGTRTENLNSASYAEQSNL